MEPKKTEIKMPRTFFGNTGMVVPRIALGTMGFKDLSKLDFYYEIFKKAYDNGCNFIDTAEMYGTNGSCEILTGKMIKKLGANREDLIITMKLFFGIDHKEKMAHNSLGLSRKHIIEGARSSLKRL